MQPMTESQDHISYLPERANTLQPVGQKDMYPDRQTDEEEMIPVYLCDTKRI